MTSFYKELNRESEEVSVIYLNVTDGIVLNTKHKLEEIKFERDEFS